MSAKHSVNEAVKPSEALATPAARILVAEDDESFRATLVRILAREGHQCTEVTTAAAATEALDSGSLDLLIADLQMPDSAGCGLIRRAAGLDVPVIVLTGNPSLSTAMESIRLHVAGYLVKPPEWSELRELVRVTLAASSRRRILRTQQQRLTTWSSDLRQLHQAIQSRPGDASLFSEHLNHLVADLSSTVGELVSASDALPQATPSADSAQLLTALQETIAVLEQTKHAFKSKQLGSLRQKLSKLIGPPPAGPGPDDARAL